MAGRRLEPINWNEFERMCFVQCTLEELAYAFDRDVATLQKEIKDQYGKTYSQVMEEKQSFGKTALRRVQMQKALKGDNTMLIWLGKNILGQTDKHEETVKVEGNIRFTKEALVQAIKDDPFLEADYEVLGDSSKVEPSAVNRAVEGSSPSPPAKEAKE